VFNNPITAVVFILVALFLIFCGPLIGIWVINTLFDVQNPYDLTHWFAVLISGFAFGTRVSSSSS
jgi:hypothetical protein